MVKRLSLKAYGEGRKRTRKATGKRHSRKHAGSWLSNVGKVVKNVAPHVIKYAPAVLSATKGILSQFDKTKGVANLIGDLGFGRRRKHSKLSKLSHVSHMMAMGDGRRRKHTAGRKYSRKMSAGRMTAGRIPIDNNAMLHHLYGKPTQAIGDKIYVDNTDLWKTFNPYEQQDYFFRNRLTAMGRKHSRKHSRKHTAGRRKHSKLSKMSLKEMMGLGEGRKAGRRKHTAGRVGTARRHSHKYSAGRVGTARRHSHAGMSKAKERGKEIAKIMKKYKCSLGEASKRLAGTY